MGFFNRTVVIVNHKKLKAKTAFTHRLTSVAFCTFWITILDELPKRRDSIVIFSKGLTRMSAVCKLETANCIVLY